MTAVVFVVSLLVSFTNGLYFLPDASDLEGTFTVVESAQANGRSSCVIAGSREMQIFNVSFNDKSRMNGTFGASTYLTAWTGRWSVVGPGVSVDMRVFNNTRCFGSFARVSAQDAGMLDLTCAFLREDGLQTIDSTCKVTFVSNDFHYYLLMLLWNIAATVASLAAAFFAAFCAATQRTAVRRGVSDALRHQQLSPGAGSFHRGINADDGSDDSSAAPPSRRRRPVVAVAAAADERTRLRANVESSD